MVCPKCEEETIFKIRFKKSGKIAYLCECCEALWFEDEGISLENAHTLESFLQKEDADYEPEELAEKDQDSKPIRFTVISKYKE